MLFRGTDEPLTLVETRMRFVDSAKPGERLVITAGMPFGTPGTTNVLRIATVGE